MEPLCLHNLADHIAKHDFEVSHHA